MLNIKEINVREIFKRFGLPIVLLTMILLFTILNPNFLKIYNIQNIFKQSSINGFITMGMVFIILLGCIDLSVGSTLALSGFVMANLIVAGIPFPIVLLAGLAVGFLIGLFNGILVAKFKLQPFIATLVTMTMVRGFTLIYSDGMPVRKLAENSVVIEKINSTIILGILPVSMFILVVVFIIAKYVLEHTVYGKHLYATGGNEVAAKYATVDTVKVKLIAYIIIGLLTAIAAVFYISRYDSIYPTAGVAMELDAIAAVAIGGISMAGGRGKIGGAFIGVFIIGVINNGLNILGVSSYYQEVIKGAIILLAVLMDRQEK